MCIHKCILFRINLQKISLKKFAPQGCGMSSSANGIPSSWSCCRATSGFTIRKGRDSLGNKRVRNISDQIPTVPAWWALFVTFFSRGHRSWHPARIVYATPRDHTNSPFVRLIPNRANKQPQRDVERQLWHIIYIYTYTCINPGTLEGNLHSYLGW